MTDKLEALKSKYGLDQMNAGPLQAPLSIDFYENWLTQKYHGGMSYLEDHLPLKKNPRALNSGEPGLCSVISVAQSYFPAAQPSALNVPARTALYARNEDYHFWLKEKLNLIIRDLKEIFPGQVFLPFVDSGPLLERELAFRNGLGWFGKNTCLIHPSHGSLFFIAEILTSVPVNSETEALPDLCGKCTRCLEVCPTGALVSPKLMKADQCISYLTIESKEIPEEPLRNKIGDWFFGCDLCQTVCPWNEKVFRTKKIETTSAISKEPVLILDSAARLELVEYFRFLLTASHKQIQKYHFGSPLLRAGAKGLKRNALIVIANRGLYELKSEVASLEAGGLKELAGWTLARLN